MYLTCLDLLLGMFIPIVDSNWPEHSAVLAPLQSSGDPVLFELLEKVKLLCTALEGAFFVSNSRAFEAITARASVLHVSVRDAQATTPAFSKMLARTSFGRVSSVLGCFG